MRFDHYFNNLKNPYNKIKFLKQKLRKRNKEVNELETKAALL